MYELERGCSDCNDKRNGIYKCWFAGAMRRPAPQMADRRESASHRTSGERKRVEDRH